MLFGLCGTLPCLCGVSKLNTGPVKVSPRKWSEEEDQWVKTNLQTCQGVELTDITMSTIESQKLEALLHSTKHTVLILTVHVGFITLRHDV